MIINFIQQNYNIYYNNVVTQNEINTPQINLYNFVKNSNINESLKQQIIYEILLGSNVQNKFIACNDDKQYQLYQINIIKDNEDQYQIAVTKVQVEPKFVNAFYSDDAYICLNSQNFAHSDYNSNYYIFDSRKSSLQVSCSENNNASNDQESAPNGTEEFLIQWDREYECPFLPNVKYVFASSCTVSALPWKTQYLNVFLGSLHCQIIKNLKNLHSLVLSECSCDDEVDLSLTNLTKVGLTCVQIKKLKLPNSLKYFTVDHPKFDLQESISNTLELELFQLSVYKSPLDLSHLKKLKSMKTEYANSGVGIPLHLEEVFIGCRQINITQLRNLRQLRKLELVCVEEVCSLDLSDCTNLIYLYIRQCKFASVSAPHLLNIYLTDNAFDCIGPAKNLVKIFIGKQCYSLILENHPLLQDIQICECKITYPLLINNSQIKSISVEYSEAAVIMLHGNSIQDICLVGNQVTITGIENCLQLQKLCLNECQIRNLNLKQLNDLTQLDIHSCHFDRLILNRNTKIVKTDDTVDHRQLYPLEHTTELESSYTPNSFAEFRTNINFIVKKKIRTNHQTYQDIMDYIFYQQCTIQRKVALNQQLCYSIKNKTEMKQRILNQMQELEELVRKWQ